MADVNFYLHWCDRKAGHVYLQESNRLFAGEKGYGSLRNMQKRLRTRQHYMISQVSLLYPVKISVGPAQEQELELFPSSSQSGICQ